MNARREAILDAIIRDYVDTAEPVGSLTLVEKYDFPYSPATIRAEMADLEDEGYIYQPHTSAGRVPTEKGYRYFVNLILNETKQLQVRDQAEIRQRILSQHLKYEKLLDLAAKAMAEVTGNVGIVGLAGLTYSHGLTNLFSQPEFLDRDNVLKASEILDRMHELVEDIPNLSQPKVYIGSESPIGKASDCSVVVCGFETPYNTAGRLAILGPTRMYYPQVISTINDIKMLLESWKNEDSNYRSSETRTIKLDSSHVRSNNKEKRNGKRKEKK